jgi:hypothetical protein
MDESLVRRSAVVLLAVAQLLAPLLLFPGNFNDQTAKPPLAAPANPATPAGYAFAIWAVIYVGALIYAIYQALPSNAQDALLQRIGWLTAAGYMLCVAWILAARFGPGWMTVPIILCMLACLGAAFLIAVRWPEPLGATWHAVVLVPLAIYVGWLSAATFVNAADVLPGYGFDRFGLSAQTFGVLVVIAAGMVGLAVTLWTAAYPPYVLTLLWALVSIVANNGVPARGNPVSNAAALVALAVVLVSIGIWLTGRRGRAGERRP